MKLLNKFTFIFLCCLNMAACNDGNILARMFPTQEQRQRQLNDKLSNAAKAGDLHAVKQAFNAGADIHEWNDYALRWAAESGHLPVVQFLVEHGANVNDALRCAAENGHLPIVKYLLAHGANVHARNDGALRWAAWGGQLAVVQFLVEHGANIHAEDEGALQWAAENGHLPIVKYLLAHGANAKNDHAFHLAVYNEHWVVAACLLQHGANKIKLSARRQQALRTSAQVHAYILAELRAALSKNDWPAVERVLDIVPRQELPIEIKEQIGQLMVAAAEKGMPTLPLHVQERILSFMMGPITWHYFIQQRNKALGLPGETHETV